MKKLAAWGIGIYVLQAIVGTSIGFYAVLVTNGGFDEIAASWSWLL